MQGNKLTEEQKRQLVSWILGEELASTPWGVFDFWHEGAIGFSNCSQFEYRTVFVNDSLLYAPTPVGWERVGSYPHSGRGPCPLQWQDLDLGACPLCGATPDAQGSHPYEGLGLSIGEDDDWSTVVYRRLR